ncbi:MAG TPA: EamA family transporter [Bacteroidota bacterium]|nr:EamA family transporter [Bacteroidota bacterium]
MSNTVRPTAKITAGFIVISLIWGSTWLAIKIGLDSVPPFYGAAIRFTVGSVILALLVLFRKERLSFDRGALAMYGTLGILSFGVPFALVYWSEQYIPSGLASVLFAAYPFVVAIGSHLLLAGERLTVYKSAGVLLGFTGVLAIFWSDLSLGSAGVGGMIAILISTFLQGTSLVIVKRWNRGLSPTVLTLGGMLVGVIILYAIAGVAERVADIRLDPKGICSILYLGSFGTVMTFVVYYWLLTHVEAVYLSLVSFVTPVLAVILGALVLGESFSSRVVLGAGLILAGIAVTNAHDLLTVVRTAAMKRNGERV